MSTERINGQTYAIPDNSCDACVNASVALDEHRGAGRGVRPNGSAEQGVTHAPAMRLPPWLVCMMMWSCTDQGNPYATTVEMPLPPTAASTISDDGSKAFDGVDRAFANASDSASQRGQHNAQTGQSSYAIIDGTVDDARTFSSVGAIVTTNDLGEGVVTCSASLVDAHWVLTVAHCVSMHEGRPERMRVTFQVDAREGVALDPAHVHSVRRIVLHPSYARASVGAPQPHDLALLELVQPREVSVPFGIPSRATTETRFNPLYQEMHGQRVWPYAVGYGVAAVDPADPGLQEGLRRSAQVPALRVVPTLIMTLNSDPSTCHGDSGGALLDCSDGVCALTGVVSAVGGNPTCGNYTLSVRVDAASEWIRSVMGYESHCQLCACATSCNNQWCDDAQCGTTCRDIVTCAQRCSPEADASQYQRCWMACQIEARQESMERFVRWLRCAQEECGELPIDQRPACQERACGVQFDECISDDATVEQEDEGLRDPVDAQSDADVEDMAPAQVDMDETPAIAEPCGELLACIVGCANVGSQRQREACSKPQPCECQYDCYEQADNAARHRYNELQQCLGACDARGLSTQWCRQACHEFIAACMPQTQGCFEDSVMWVPGECPLLDREPRPGSDASVEPPAHDADAGASANSQESGSCSVTPGRTLNGSGNLWVFVLFIVCVLRTRRYVEQRAQ